MLPGSDKGDAQNGDAPTSNLGWPNWSTIRLAWLDREVSGKADFTTRWV